MTPRPITTQEDQYHYEQDGFCTRIMDSLGDVFLIIDDPDIDESDIMMSIFAYQQGFKNGRAYGEADLRHRIRGLLHIDARS